MPATIEFILRETGQDKIHIIGHSQSVSVVLGFFAGNHSYDDKVNEVSVFKLPASILRTRRAQCQGSLHVSMPYC